MILFLFLQRFDAQQLGVCGEDDPYQATQAEAAVVGSQQDLLR